MLPRVFVVLGVAFCFVILCDSLVLCDVGFGVFVSLVTVRLLVPY